MPPGSPTHRGAALHLQAPHSGHKLKFYMRDDTRVGMGHTRMTTQGKASKNRNNHPFRASSEANHLHWPQRSPLQ